MKTLSTILLAVSFSLACVSCESREEEAREKALENRADRLEDQAKATEKAGDNAAKNVEKAAENQSDALKNEADKNSAGSARRNTGPMSPPATSGPA